MVAEDILRRSDYRERLLPGTPDDIFAAFRKPEVLARWWGPEGFTSTFSAFDFREGGDWHFVMHGPDGTDYPNHQRFHELVEGQKIVTEHIGAPHFFLTITLKPEINATLLTWLQTFDDEAVWQSFSDFAPVMNEQNLSRLEKVLTETTEENSDAK